MTERESLGGFDFSLGDGVLFEVFGDDVAHQKDS
jgi:hypothetical protein